MLCRQLSRTSIRCEPTDERRPLSVYRGRGGHRTLYGGQRVARPGDQRRCDELEHPGSAEGTSHHALPRQLPQIFEHTRPERKTVDVEPGEVGLACLHDELPY